jgi:hypothetical protein
MATTYSWQQWLRLIAGNNGYDLLLATMATTYSWQQWLATMAMISEKSSETNDFRLFKTI